MPKKKNPFKDDLGLPRRGYEKSAKAWDEAQEEAASLRRTKKLFQRPRKNPFVDSSGAPLSGYRNSAIDWKPPVALDSAPLIAGVVYVLTNSALPGLVKIGWTERSVEDRVKELQTTGVPAPFRIAYALNHPFASKLERLIHMHLKEKRYRGNREFFRCTVAQAISVVEECAKSM